MKLFTLALALLSVSVYPVVHSQIIKAQYSFMRGEAEVLEKKRDYTIYSGSIELLESTSNADLSFKYRLYQAQEAAGRLIVLTPNIEGVTVLERRLADRLAGAGFHVLVPFARSERPIFDHLTSMRIERAFTRAMAATLYMIDEVQKLISFDVESMGLAGASQGGIRSATLFGIDSRFKAVFISVAGGDLPSLYADTEIDQLVEFRESHMHELNFAKVEKYETYLRSKLILDPLLITQSPHLSGVAMIIANEDSIVPTMNQWKLWSAIKEAGFHPKTYVKDVTHVTGALMLIRHEREMIRWFSEKLFARP